MSEVRRGVLHRPAVRPGPLVGHSPSRSTPERVSRPVFRVDVPPGTTEIADDGVPESIAAPAGRSLLALCRDEPPTRQPERLGLDDAERIGRFPR